MNKHLALFCLLGIFNNLIFSQQPADLSFQLLQTETTEQPPSITFRWKKTSTPNQIKIFRKSPSIKYFDSNHIVGKLSGGDTIFTDNNLTEGLTYDFMLQSYDANDKVIATTYIYGAVNKPQTDYRGKIIILVDSILAKELSPEIDQLCADIEGDGWIIIKHTVSRSEAPQQIKAFIKSAYNKDKENVKSVFLLGHIAVPYSGNFAPDGHTDHFGAWPCDGYYADMTGEWTDTQVNNSSATDIRNKNIPGDNKFDQSFLPSTLELETGRVDFYNLPLFGLSETELMKQYLNKNHNYKHKKTNVKQQAIIKDLFGYFGGESFSTCGWRNFASMFPAQDVFRAEYIASTLSSEPYLWAYASSPGNYSSCMYVVQSSDFATKKIGAVFNLFFGSYFGDWDSENNLMRSVLASGGYGLTCSWAGRPYNIMHHMAMGNHIGKSMQLTMQNTTNYNANIFYGSAALALMGDPTLRMHVVSPVSNVVLSKTNRGFIINWNKSEDDVLGYYVYKYDNTTSNYIRLNSLYLSDTFYTDTCNTIMPQYMVKAAKKEHSNSGSYINLSQGIIAQNLLDSKINQKSDESISVFPNPIYNRTFNITNLNHNQYTYIEIIDLCGKVVYESIITEFKTSIILPKSIKEGTYIFKIRNSDKTESRILTIRQ